MSSLFFTVLAVFDTLSLLTGLMRYWLIGLTDHDVRNNSRLSCRLHTFLVYWSADVAGWILALVAAERCFAANWPHVYKRTCTRPRAAISLVMCATILAVINCHFLFTLDIVVEHSNGTESSQACRTVMGVYYQEVVFHWIDFVFYCIGPFVCILGSNLSIAVRVLRSRMQTSTRDGRISSMTAILICVSVFYIFCTAPIAAYLVAQQFWIHDVSFAMYGKMQVYFALAALVSYLNNSMNFLLYCLSGPRFRRELCQLCQMPSIPEETSGSGL